MATSPRRTREHWIRAALEVLRDEGVERVRVEPLALKLGVTKGSFYWHFENREALIEAALDTWVADGTEAAIRTVSATEESPKAKLRALWALVHDKSLGDMRTEVAIRDLGQRDAAVQARVQQVDERRMEFLRSLFRGMGLTAAQAEVRSLLVYSLLIGDHFIAAQHGRMSRTKVLSLALDDLLRD